MYIALLVKLCDNAVSRMLNIFVMLAQKILNLCLDVKWRHSDQGYWIYVAQLASSFWWKKKQLEKCDLESKRILNAAD